MPTHISSQWRRSGQTGSFPISHWPTGSLSIHPKGLKSTLVAWLMSVDKGAQATLMQRSRVRQCALCIRPLTCQRLHQGSALWWHAAHKRALWCNTPMSCFLNAFLFRSEPTLSWLIAEALIMLPIVCLCRLLLGGVAAILTTSISNRKMPQLTSPRKNNTLASSFIPTQVILMPRKDKSGPHLQPFFLCYLTYIYLIW